MNWECLFDIDGMKKQMLKLEKQSYAQDLWQDIDKAQKIMQKTKALKNQIEEFEGLKSRIEDLEILIELSMEEEDYDVYNEKKRILKRYPRKQKILNHPLY